MVKKGHVCEANQSSTPSNMVTSFGKAMGETTMGERCGPFSTCGLCENLWENEPFSMAMLNNQVVHTFKSMENDQFKWILSPSILEPYRATIGALWGTNGWPLRIHWRLNRSKKARQLVVDVVVRQQQLTELGQTREVLECQGRVSGSLSMNRNNRVTNLQHENN